MKQEKIAKVLPILVFLVFLLIGVGVRFMMLGTANANLTKSTEALIQAKNARDSVLTMEEEKKQGILNETTGLDLVRQKHDDELLRPICNTIFTWNNFETYNKAKEAMLKTYQMNETVVNRLMPKVNSLIGKDGKEFNAIDAKGLKMQFLDLTSYVVKISGTDYSYLTEVRVEGADFAGYTEQGRILLSYDVSLNGEVKNFNGFTLVD